MERTFAPTVKKSKPINLMIQKIRLTNFRNFKKKVFEFSDTTTIILGPNGAGKTNILESLFLLSTGKSFKARVEEEMINYDEEFSKIEGRINDLKLDAILTKNSTRKKLLVNGISRRLVDFAGNFKVVLFGPWDMDLVTESPSVRRRFLDTVLSQVDREYRRAISSYEKGLRQRNRILLRIREEGASRSQLLFWDKLLIKNGDYVSQKRQEFIEYINSRQQINDHHFSIEYDRSAISESRLEQYKDEEVAAATTLVGPHRDDIIFYMDKRNMASFASRGEQRMSVLWVKLAELGFIEEKTNERPTLLLDDIFSELDHDHRKIAVAASKNQQTIMTTADPHFTEGLKGVQKIII